MQRRGNTQIDRVLRTLKETGIASRNYFLDLPYDKITRLSDVILKLRTQGYDITTETTEKDTIYHLKPKRVETYRIETGEVYTKKIYV